MEKKPKILVIGSLIMDQIVVVKEVPQEGQRVFAKAFVKAPGGKGANQAVQAAKLGAEVTIIGKVGRDANGKELVRACRREGMSNDLLHIPKRNHLCLRAKFLFILLIVDFHITGRHNQNRLRTYKKG